MEEPQKDKDGPLETSKTTKENRIEFLRCSNCRLMVRSDDTSHDQECRGRKKHGNIPQNAEEQKQIAENGNKESEWSRIVSNPKRQEARHRRAKRKAEAKAMESKPSIPSSWNTDKTKKLRSIISVPFESNKRKH